MASDIITELPQAKRSKYGAKRTEYNGRMYASKKEAARAAELDLLTKAGEIVQWIPQPVFPLEVMANNGTTMTTVGRYIADFKIWWTSGAITFEDVKSAGTRTPVYRLKKKLVEALYGVVIEEK